MLANRRDSNEKELDAFFEAAGWQVTDTSRVGPSKAVPGFPDRIISKAWCVVLVEYKHDSRLSSLSDAERTFHSKFVGPLEVVWDLESAQKVSDHYGRNPLA